MTQQTFRFIHCSDLHIDSPFTGMASVDDKFKNTVTESTFRAFTSLINLAVREKVDFILMAGDIYDSSRHSMRARLEFLEGLKTAAEHNISVYMVHGNHDPLNSWRSDIDYPDNFYRFGPDLEKAEFIKDGEVMAEIWGISYPVAEIRDNLALEFQRISRSGSSFVIGLLHCNIGSISRGHENYSPCSLQDLRSAPLDYWALGHVHNARVISDSSPAIVYSGNTQGRHANESGRKGCYVVDVKEGHIADISFRDTAAVLWHNLEIDITGIKDPLGIIELIRGECASLRRENPGVSHVARFTLMGAVQGDSFLEINWAEEMVDSIRKIEAGKLDPVWIESVRTGEVSVYDRDALMHEDSFLSDFLKISEELGKNPGMLSDWIKDIGEFRTVWSFIRDPEDDIWEVILEEAEKKGIMKLLGGWDG